MKILNGDKQVACAYNKDYTNPDGSKKSGRGGCKAACWVDTAIVIAEKVLRFLDK